MYFQGDTYPEAQQHTLRQEATCQSLAVGNKKNLGREGKSWYKLASGKGNLNQCDDSLQEHRGHKTKNKKEKKKGENRRENASRAKEKKALLSSQLPI